LSWFALALLAATPALGQEGASPVGSAGQEHEERLRVELRISIAGPGARVLVDRGQSDGLAVGDEVVFRPREGGVLRGTVTRVDDRSATVEMLDAGAVPSAGTRGEVFVPSARFAPDAKPAGEPPVQPAPGELETAEPATEPAAEPEHAWTNKDEEWRRGDPLLARVKPVRPEDRAMLYTGRMTLYGDGTLSTESGRYDGQVRAGLDATVENISGLGDEVHFAGEVDHFVFRVPDEDDENDSALRLERLSYALGGTRFAPHRFEAGRFLQHGMPEFGYLDGFEWNLRRDNGQRLGASIGYMPDLTPDFTTGDSFQVSGFYEWLVEGRADLSVAAGAQKTWYEGSPDRDLLIGRVDYLPRNDWDLRGSAWVDFYDSGDTKDGLDVTQALLSSTRRWERDGLTLMYRRLRFPDIERLEYEESIFEDLVDARQDRVSVTGYHETEGDTRMHASLGLWTDEEEDGGDCEVGADVPGAFADDGLAGISLFLTRGAYSLDGGLRLSYGIADDDGRWDVHYVYADRHQDGFSHESDDLWEHTLRGTRAFYLKDGWHLSLDSDLRYFDDELAFSLAMYLQKTF
jgi:hypothetical protein